MKLLTFSIDNSNITSIAALLDNNSVLDLNVSSESKILPDMLSFISGGEEQLNLAKKMIKNPNPKAIYQLKEIKLKAPILYPPFIERLFCF